MQVRFCLAALAAACLVFSWQPALAQYGDDDDDGYEQEQARQYQEHNDCVDAIAANMGDPSVMTRIGLSPKAAEFTAKVYDKIQENFANLVIMQRYIDNLDLIKPVLAGKKDSKARKLIEDIQANVRGQMEQLRGQMNAMSELLLGWASNRCQKAERAARRRSAPPVSLGIGVGVDLSGDNRSRRHGDGHGGKKKKSGDGNWQDPNSQEQGNEQQGGNHSHSGCGPN